MVMTHQALLNKLAEFPTIEKILNGTILRDKVVSRAGKTSAVIFVPKYLLGQKLQVILVPEDTEVAGLSETVERKFSEVAGLKEKNRILESQISDVEGSNVEEKKPEVEDKSLEDDAY